MKAVSALATGLRQAASAAGAARSLASAAARPAAAATAAAAAVPPPSAAGAAAAQPSSSMPSLSELLPPRPRKVVRRGGRKLPTIARPEDSPYVADHVVSRAVGVAPPGTKLADVTVLGKPLRPDLASGVTAAGSDSDGGTPVSVRHRFDDSSSAASSSSNSASSGSSSSSSSGPDSASSSAGSASEGEGAAAVSSSRRAPSTLDGPTAAAAAGDALGAAASPAASSPRAFAVIALGGTQYKVTPGDVINAEYVRGVDVGSALDVTAVHVVGTAARTVLGRPTVPGAVVRCTVEEVVRDAKVVVYKKNRRKRYQKTQGHRRLVTRLRVNAIDCDVGAF